MLPCQPTSRSQCLTSPLVALENQSCWILTRASKRIEWSAPGRVVTIFFPVATHDLAAHDLEHDLANEVRVESTFDCLCRHLGRGRLVNMFLFHDTTA